MQYFGFDRTLGRSNVLGFGDDFVGSELPVDPVEPEPIATIPQDYILRYDFDGDYLDKSVAQLHGVKTGNASFSAGRKIGKQALSFISGKVKIPPTSLIASNALTISMWIKTSQSNVGIILRNNNYIKDGYGLIVSGEYIKVTDRLSNNELVKIHPNTSDWLHILMVFDRDDTSGLVTPYFYANNSTIGVSQQGSIKNKKTLTGGSLIIGSNDAGEFPFVGLIQDIRIYNRALSEAERTQLFNE